MRSKSVAALRGQRFFRKVVVPVLEFLVALGTSAVAYLGMTKRYAFVLGQGVSPASNLTSNLPQSLVTQFDKVFVENLKSNVAWVRCTSRRQLDENSGNKLVLFMYLNLPTPPTTQAPEGTIMTGLTVTVVQNTSVIGNYAD